MKRIVTSLTLVALRAVAAGGLTAEGPLLPLVWPGAYPDSAGPIGEEEFVAGKHFSTPVQALTSVHRLTVTVDWPAQDKHSHAAGMVAPHGRLDAT